MKSIKILLVLVLLLSLGFSSCEEFLKEEVKDKISVDYIYDSPDGLDVGVNALYNLMRKYNLPSGDNADLWSNVFFMVGTDLGLHRTWNTPYGTGHNPTAFTGSKWIQGYKIIDRCSAIITAARKVEMDAAVKNKLVAQARVIRGEVYLDLKEMYGNILIDTIATTPENINDPVEYKVASDADVYKLIDGDLDFAIKYLDYKVSPGRYGQGVARHIRGKSAMWQKDYAGAAAHFDAVINEGTHALVTLGEVWGQNGNHRESLFTYQKDQLLGANDDLAGGGGSWLSSVFTHRTYELNANELVQDVAYGGQALGWFYPNNYLKSLYDQTNDLRFKTYYYSDNYLDYKINVPTNPKFGQPITNPAIAAPNGNYRRWHWSLKKYHDTEKLPMTSDSYKDYMYYRLAETYLLASEAYHYLGNDTKALLYLNKVRRRGYTGNPISTVSTYDITSWTLNTYLDESARELAFEKNRWFLLKRLGLLVERQNLYFKSSTAGTISGERPLNMTPAMVNMPIPQSQINLMGNPPGFNVGY
ncbi:RagB/SusD family nutrient uptake outer membrane protein [Flavobacterium sp. A45]|uniref:RagB/SusD family nutrient uptake outer membrane protein n=1 Tax=Flavobacterium sp. A45 TaxID=1945862 RepID=UPI00098777D0|nr:RagB/SusD family nutrient uptake outer membrane protein [Flavobacterium sp. A45]OOG62658.1 RagB/SusD family nutrient uptake outer membrane protein [Flavobacterium sp. A45]